MITLYGKKYAKNDREAIDSLFAPGGTVNGFYKRTSGGIVLLDLQRNERGFVRKDGLGPVSVTRVHGRRYYMQAASSKDATWLGIPEKYSEAVAGAKAAAMEGAE
jgi:hypothetical protein